MEKLKTAIVHMIERVSFTGPEEKRKETTTVMAAFPDEIDAESWLQKHLEDDYGWDLTRFKVVPDGDGKRVRVTDMNPWRGCDRDYHVYTIKEAALLMEEVGP